MSIDTEVEGQSHAVSATGDELSSLGELIGSTGSRLDALRSDAAAAWDGLRSDAHQRDARAVSQEMSELRRGVTTFAEDIATFATELMTVEQEMSDLRTSALYAGLSLTATTIEQPLPLGPDADDTAEQEHGEQVGTWEALSQQAYDIRTRERSAHETLAGAISAFLSTNVVLDLAQRAGFAPSETDAGGIGSWVAKLGLKGAGWTSSWMTKVKLGRFAPRGPGGQFRAIGQPWYKEAFAATRDRNWVAKPHQGPTRSSWKSAGKWVSGIGTAISFGTAAWGQWQDDSHDPSLGGVEKAGRAATMGAATAAGGWAGAWAGGKLGAAVGTAIGGPAGAVVGGAIGGIVGGIVGSGAGEAIGDAVKDGVGQAAEAVKDGVGKVADKLAFWK